VRIALFCHSLLSDWNHGNAHFLRGLVSELSARGHEVVTFEPSNAWSVQNLVASSGMAELSEVRKVYPSITAVQYEEDTLDLDEALASVSLVLVHEWSSEALVRRVGEHRAKTGSYLLLYHDTHHRSITDPEAMGRCDLSRYDGVLAFGRVIRDIYLARGWARRAFVFHEAADVRVFYPRKGAAPECDLVWIGNGGDDERTHALFEFLIGPARDLGLEARCYGVRYPADIRAALAAAGIEYRGFLPNYHVPEALARGRMTVHVPRRPYVERLHGIPTIRPFEALASGIPLICSPWSDAEGLFSPGRDYLVARDGGEMKRHLKTLLDDPESAREMAERGLRTVLARHTCAHRVDELFGIAAELGLLIDSPEGAPPAKVNGGSP
jgi:spore maturation protein CgeB